MRRTFFPSLLLVLFAVPAAPTHAGDFPAAVEDRDARFGLGAFAGGHFFAEGTNLGVAGGPQTSQGARSGAGAGLRATLGLGRWFAAEVEVLGVQTDDRTYQRKARILGYRLNALANLWAGDFRPFLLVGAGAIQVAATDAEGNSGLVHDTDGEVHVGLGFDYRLADRLSVRGDARVVQMPSKENWGLTTDVEATLGASVAFGSERGDSARNRVRGVAAAAPGAGRGEAEFAQATATATPAAATPSAPPVPPQPAPEAARPPAPDIPSPAEPKTLPASSAAVAVETKARTVSDLLGRAKEIKFEGATSKLSTGSMPFLDELATALEREPSVRLEIVCHTPAGGDAKKDLALSRRRAESVKSALVQRGVPVDRLVATGRGSEDPIAPNITRSGRMLNDRVELHRAEARKAEP